MKRVVYVLLPLMVLPLIALSVMAWSLAGRTEDALLITQRRQHETVASDFAQRLDERLDELADALESWGRKYELNAPTPPPELGQRWAMLYDDQGRWIYPVEFATHRFDSPDTHEGGLEELAEVVRLEQVNPAAELIAERYRSLADRETLPAELRAKALFGLARCLRRMGRDDEVTACYERLMTDFRETFDETGVNLGAEAASAFVAIRIQEGEPEAGRESWRRYARDLLAYRYPMTPALALGHIRNALAIRPTEANADGDAHGSRQLELMARQLGDMIDADGATTGHAVESAPQLSMLEENVLVCLCPDDQTGGRRVVAAFGADHVREKLLAPLINELNERRTGVAFVNDSRNATIVGTPVDLESMPTELSLARWGLPWTLKVGFADLAALRQQARQRHALLTGTIGLMVLLITLGAVLGWRMVQREMELSKLKSDFVDNVSHELRTPVTSIKLFSEMLQQGSILDESRRLEYYRLLASESGRLARMVDNMLDFSRIVAGRMQLSPRPTDMQAYLSELVPQLQIQARATGHRIHLNLGENLPTCRVDADVLSRAIANLVSNAIKYSPDEREITLTAQRRDGAFSLAVRDRGIGIPPEQVPHVFDRFYRASHAGSEHMQGTGLGLTIVRDSVERHGGTVAIQSRPGQGTVVELLIPIDTRAELS